MCFSYINAPLDGIQVPWSSYTVCVRGDRERKSWACACSLELLRCPKRDDSYVYFLHACCDEVTYNAKI